MKVMLVSHFAPDHQESMLRFSRLLTQHLPDAGIEPILVAPQRRLTRLIPNYRYAGWQKYVGYLDKFALFPIELRRAIAHHQPAVVHLLDHAHSGYASAAGSIPVVLTCHDLLQIRAAAGEIPQQPLSPSGRKFQDWIRHHIATVPNIVCVSKKTRDDLNRLIPRQGGRTEVIYNGLSYPYSPLPMPLARKRVSSLWSLPEGKNPGRFYLNVGGGQWYKNRPGLLHIFAGLFRAQPDLNFVMVGKPLSTADAALASRLGLTSALRHFSNLPSKDLAALYQLSEGLIFPSWEEGFGWPIAEAQACGCPVFTSDRAPMTEVGGDAAVYFNPAAPDEAVAQILAAQSNRGTMSARGILYAANWDPKHMIDAYAALYRSLANVNS
jgi:glycosyltransferase involved in cell wall biosynthesis